MTRYMAELGLELATPGSAVRHAADCFADSNSEVKGCFFFFCPQT